VLLEEVDAPAVHGHWRRVGEHDAVLLVQRENRVLRRRFAGVRLEHDVDGRDQRAVFVVHPGTTRQRERGAVSTQRIRGPAERSVGEWRIPEKAVEHRRRADLALKRGAVDGFVHVTGAKLV
jgi:hypothetical protein